MEKFSIKSKLFWSQKYVRSYVSHEWRDNSLRVQDELSQFMSGMNRTVASKTAESGESLDEGKKLMSCEVYKKLWEFLFEV